MYGLLWLQVKQESQYPRLFVRMNMHIGVGYFVQRDLA